MTIEVNRHERKPGKMFAVFESELESLSLTFHICGICILTTTWLSVLVFHLLSEIPLESILDHKYGTLAAVLVPAFQAFLWFVGIMANRRIIRLIEEQSFVVEDSE